MTKLRITLAAKKNDSALLSYLSNQLTNIEWIDYDRAVFPDIKDNMAADFFVTVLEGISFQEILDVCDLFRRIKKNSTYISFWNNTIIAGPTHFPGNTAG